MPKDKSIQKVLVIGSGPIVIGQAAEFDYAGAQACRVLRQEGIRTVLVNSNPAPPRPCGASSRWSGPTACWRGWAGRPA